MKKTFPHLPFALFALVILSINGCSVNKAKIDNDLKSFFDEKKVVDPKITNKKQYIADLVSFVADKRTTIEVCLTSNLQTNPEIKDIKNHNFKHMLANRMSVTICTDNRLVSDTTVSREFQLAVDNFDIPIKQLKDIVAYGFKKSFYPGQYIEKRNWAKNVMMYFDKIAKKHGVMS